MIIGHRQGSHSPAASSASKLSREMRTESWVAAKELTLLYWAKPYYSLYIYIYIYIPIKATWFKFLSSNPQCPSLRAHLARQARPYSNHIAPFSPFPTEHG